MEKQRLYEVSMTDKNTGEDLKLYVWAVKADEATGRLSDALFGKNGEYYWNGTGTVMGENGKPVTRPVPEEEQEFA